jgi:hypothetical protein
LRVTPIFRDRGLSPARNESIRTGSSCALARRKGAPVLVLAAEVTRFAGQMILANLRFAKRAP